MSVSKDQKERRTASTVTTIFFEQKITTVQSRVSNDRQPSDIDEWSHNDDIKMTLLATQYPKKWKKFVPQKIASSMNTKKRHISETESAKLKI